MRPPLPRYMDDAFAQAEREFLSPPSPAPDEGEYYDTSEDEMVFDYYDGRPLR